MQLINKLNYYGRECIFKVTLDKNKSNTMTLMLHNEIVYAVEEMRILYKSIVMIVNEVKCIFMHLNLMNAWLFKPCNTCGPVGNKVGKSIEKIPSMLYSLIRELSIGGQSMEGDSGLSGM